MQGWCLPAPGSTPAVLPVVYVVLLCQSLSRNKLVVVFCCRLKTSVQDAAG